MVGKVGVSVGDCNKLRLGLDSKAHSLESRV